MRIVGKIEKRKVQSHDRNMAGFLHHLVFWTAIIGLVDFVACDETTIKNVTLTCPDFRGDEFCRYVKLAEPHRLEITCTIAEDFAINSISWIHFNGSDVNEMNSTRIRYEKSSNHSAMLTIDSVLLEDSGNYTCVTSNPGLSPAYTEVEVYIMPDYFLEGMIILAINLALCVLFIVCLVRSVIRQQKHMKALLKIDKKELQQFDTKAVV